MYLRNKRDITLLNLGPFCSRPSKKALSLGYQDRPYPSGRTSYVNIIPLSHERTSSSPFAIFPTLHPCDLHPVFPLFAHLHED
jgi:hypothetical protein